MEKKGVSIYLSDVEWEILNQKAISKNKENPSASQFIFSHLSKLLAQHKNNKCLPCEGIPVKRAKRNIYLSPNIRDEVIEMARCKDMNLSTFIMRFVVIPAIDESEKKNG